MSRPPLPPTDFPPDPSAPPLSERSVASSPRSPADDPPPPGFGREQIEEQLRIEGEIMARQSRIMEDAAAAAALSASSSAAESGSAFADLPAGAAGGVVVGGAVGADRFVYGRSGAPPPPPGGDPAPEESALPRDSWDDADPAALDPAALDDEEYARRLEQQFRDEAVARTIQEQENRASAARRQLQQPLGDAETRAAIRAAQREDAAAAARAARRRRCTVRYVLCRVLLPLASLAVVVAAVLSLVARGSVPGVDPDDLPPFFTDSWGDWGTDSGYEGGEGDFGPFQKWSSPPATDGRGLELTVINALTDEWFQYFSDAVEDWQGGSPNALRLEVRVAAEADRECSHVGGIMKACNGNYGRTGWTGLNEVLFERNRIVSSVAKMNEFYLRNAGADERQYVMCHEMGHGFGLPHRDEDTRNADLGSCLDYTSNPGANMRPDEVDFANLVGLYGKVPPGRRRARLREAGGPRPRDGEGGDGAAAAPLATTGEGDGDGRDDRRRGRLLHRSEFGEAHERDLGDGRRLVTRALF